MRIEIIQKNGSTLTAEITAPNTIIPRTGETMYLEQDAGYLQGTKELLVIEVGYVLKNSELNPVVRCIARNGAESRRELLQEHGWL